MNSPHLSAAVKAAALPPVTPIEAWLGLQGLAPFGFQREVWRAYGAGESGLIHAQTGTGKTWAIWLAAVAEALREPPPQPIADVSNAKTKRRVRASTGLKVLWITPMRALAHDTLQALQKPLEGLGLDWRVAIRTGDTASAERARQDRNMPEALVTTPESLSLLLTRADHATRFALLRLVVVDEWHELLGNKRGVQVELTLARLRALAPSLRVWGLSATLGNLDAARDALLAGRPGRLIGSDVPKRIEIDALLPPNILRFPWAGHLGTRMVAEVAAQIAQGGSTLVFTNTRSQSELWYRALLEERPEWAGVLALHHGSLDLGVRRWVERGLKAGDLRAVVCTSSLDLGVDFSPVDRVIQVGSPKGVARLLQRAGRSGHQPGAVSRVSCVPTHALELLESAAAREAAGARRIEARRPVPAPLDVLTQHVVTRALGGGFTADELLAEVRGTHAYRDLDTATWDWVLAFVTRGGVLAAYPEYRRVVIDAEGRYGVPDAKIARRHRASIGTIVSDATISVQYVRGSRLGRVEESFIARLKPGDRFVVGGKLVEFVRVREMTAWVRRAKTTRGIVPRWMGGRMPLSNELSRAVRSALEAARDGRTDSAETALLRPLLALQMKLSVLPAADELLIERHVTREGHHLAFFPFAGRHANAGLAALCAWRLARRAPVTFSMAANDYGFELLSPTPVDIESALAADLFTLDNLHEDLKASINAAELARRHFREIARVAGLVFQGYPGDTKSNKQLQVSTGLLYDVFAKHDAGNPLLAQAEREVLERELDYSRLTTALREFQPGKIIVRAPRRMTPLALPLYAESMRERLSTEELADRVARLQLAMLKGVA